jgi:fermentation-respiration switch protein FrsA (DUF1100 family)
MKSIWSIIILLFCISTGIAQNNKYFSEEKNITPLVDGTLLIPETSNDIPLVIIIQGSGPVDRDGNQNMQKNNCLRFLAEGLIDNGIASFRYDKRIVKLLKRGALKEEEIAFDQFIQDAISVIDYFKNDERFSKIYIVGHSQGSLVGMVAAQGRAHGFISIAGAGQEIDDVIVDQLELQAPALKDDARTAFDDMRVNGFTVSYSPGLASIFRPSLQNFLLDWMKYNPQEEIKKLDMPVMIINGTKDIQVSLGESEKLKNARPDAVYVIIENMNHIFKEILGDSLENSKSYNEYNRPIIPILLEKIAAFVLE